MKRKNPEAIQPSSVVRAFWQRFIDEVSFNLPEQPAAKHGGRNWVKIPMPSKGHWLTAYGFEERLGIYLSYDWADRPELYNVLKRDLAPLRKQTGVSLDFNQEKKWIGVNRTRSDIGDENAQIAWLCVTANALATALRPRLESLLQGHTDPGL